MGIEFIGFVGHFNSSETMARSGPAIDPRLHRGLRQGAGICRVRPRAGGVQRDLGREHDGVAAHRRQHRAAGPDGRAPSRLRRPTLAARQLATLDHLSQGRAAVHVITGGNDTEMAQDGDHLTKDERYARTSEYLDVMRQEWTAAAPFDHHGTYYQVDRGFSDVKPFNPAGIPVYFGGASDAAIPVAGKHADIYALWGETHDQVRALIARIRAAAARYRPHAALQPVAAAGAGRHGGEGLGQGGRHPRPRPGAAGGWPGRPLALQRAGDRRRRRPTRARAGCWRRRRRAPGWTSGCGRGSRR